MNTCIIGGNGFIGKHLIEELRFSGRSITLVSRSKFELSGVKCLQAENMFDEKFEEILADMDEIVCLAYATKPKTSFDNPVKDIEENLAQTVHLFDLAAKSKRVKKVIYVSSGGAIYGHTDAEFIEENHITKPISPYGITKLAIEHYAHLFFTLYNLPVVVVRPSNAYGPGQMAKEGQGFIAYALESVLHKRPVTIFGKDGTIRDYIYVTDLAKALIACLQYGHPGETYNIGSQQGRSNFDIVNLIRGISEIKVYGVNTIHSAARPFDVNRNVLSTAKLKAHTGWMPSVSIQDGLRSTWTCLTNTTLNINGN